MLCMVEIPYFAFVKKAELKPYFLENVLEAGVDEAGRGCLAGPVVAAAVILPLEYKNQYLNDSKQLKEAARNSLRLDILEHAIDWSVGIASVAEIDSVNILNATYLAMHRAIGGLQKRPSHLIIDGNRFKSYEEIKHTCIVGGDGKYLSIAAASILAKTTRDAIMMDLHNQEPHYGWNKNKGYGTLDHRNNIRVSGISEQHRKSFRLLPDQLSLFDAF